MGNNSEYIDTLFNTIKYELNKQRNFNYPLSIFWPIEANNMFLCGKKLEGIKIRAEVHTFKKNYTNSISIYLW